MSQTFALSNLTALGILRVEQVLGPGGTGRLSLTGNGCFWDRPDGMVALFQIGQHAPEYFLSGWPIIEWEIDPDVLPGKEMTTAPRMKYKRTIGDFFHGHIIAANGQERNWITGGWAPVEDLGHGVLRFRWTYSDGYTGGTGYPQYGITDLDYETGLFTSYGPFRIAVDGHRHISSQIIKLPTWFVDQYCPGFSYAAIGQMGSGNLGSPSGSSLIAIEDFDPTTKPPATNATDPATVQSKYLIHHGPDHKMRRPATFAICSWGNNAHPYDCRVDLKISDAEPLFGGTPNNASIGIEENDTQVGVQWVDLPDFSGLVFFYRMSATPRGYTAPGDPKGRIHVGYANALHGSQSGSGFLNRGCCHAVEGQGQFDADWGSTGPFANFHMPAVSIYPIQELIDVQQGTKKLWECVPSTELVDWREVDPLFAVTPPTHGTDYTGVIFLSGTSWVDRRDNRLYMLSAYDFATDSGGARLPHLSVYQIAGTPVPEPEPEPVPDPGLSSLLIVASGRGTPEGRVAAPMGTLYVNVLGGTNRTFWVKESGMDETGWIAK